MNIKKNLGKKIKEKHQERHVILDWLACGFDPNKSTIYVHTFLFMFSVECYFVSGILVNRTIL